MEEKRTILDQKTLIPVGLVGLLVVLIIWFVGVANKSEANAISIAKNEQAIEQLKLEYRQTISQLQDANTDIQVKWSAIDTKLTSIMGALKIK